MCSAKLERSDLHELPETDHRCDEEVWVPRVAVACSAPRHDAPAARHVHTGPWPCCCRSDVSDHSCCFRESFKLIMLQSDIANTRSFCYASLNPAAETICSCCAQEDLEASMHICICEESSEILRSGPRKVVPYSPNLSLYMCIDCDRVCISISDRKHSQRTAES